MSQTPSQPSIVTWHIGGASSPVVDTPAATCEEKGGGGWPQQQHGREEQSDGALQASITNTTATSSQAGKGRTHDRARRGMAGKRRHAGVAVEEEDGSLCNSKDCE
ncbi:hypothetical protein Ct61P_13864 [Colletotrichum tofieldiae]|nr:hypothetical protein Ct61P_13864 [Colletotrichum tofieldiae]